MIKLAGFAPDLDPFTPGILLDCKNFIPTRRGYVPERAERDMGVKNVPANVHSAAMLRQHNGDLRFFLGTDLELYEVQNDSFVSLGGGHSAVSWTFAQFGDSTLAAGSGKIKKSTGAAFTDIPGAPEAKLVVTCSDFTLAFWGDNWACSALMNPDDWTPSLSTQAQRGQLIDTPGDIVAAVTLGDDVVVYKENSVYLGRYVGAPYVWSWHVIDRNRGCVGDKAVVDVGDAHIYVSEKDILYFDGTRPVSINAEVRKWLIDTGEFRLFHRCQVAHDKSRDLLYIYFPDGKSGDTPNQALVMDMRTKRWGRSDIVPLCSLQMSSVPITYDTLNDFYPNWTGVPSYPYDSPYWAKRDLLYVYVSKDQKIVALDGDPLDSSFTTNIYGGESITKLTSLRPIFYTAPTEFSGKFYSSRNDPSAMTERSDIVAHDGRLFSSQSDRYHKVKISMSGDYEINSYAIEFTNDSAK